MHFFLMLGYYQKGTLSMRFIPLLLSTILLASCATTMTNYYQPTVQSWKGGQATELMKRWGRPDKMVRTPNGHTVYLYETETYHNATNQSYSAIGMHVGTDGRAVMTAPTAAGTSWNRGSLSTNCLALFEADKNGKILDIKTQGTNCFVGKGFSDRMSNS